MSKILTSYVAYLHYSNPHIIVAESKEQALNVFKSLWGDNNFLFETVTLPLSGESTPFCSRLIAHRETQDSGLILIDKIKLSINEFYHISKMLDYLELPLSLEYIKSFLNKKAPTLIGAFSICGVYHREWVALNNALKDS